jgi:hypothetical protein
MSVNRQRTTRQILQTNHTGTRGVIWRQPVFTDCCFTGEVLAVAALTDLDLHLAGDLLLDLPELLRRNETDDQCGVRVRLGFLVLEVLGARNRRQRRLLSVGLREVDGIALEGAGDLER